MSQWNNSYPFPSKVAWGQWWPGQSGAPGKGPGQNDKVQALGTSSWVDMLKARGSLIGSLGVKDTSNAVENESSPMNTNGKFIPVKGKKNQACRHGCACDVAGAIGVLPDELLSETSLDPQCYVPPPPLAAGLGERKPRLPRVEAWKPFKDSTERKNPFIE